MATTKKKQAYNKQSLMETYSNYLLTHGKRPVNVYAFMKDIGQDESAFYQFFSSMEMLEDAFLKHFFSESERLVGQMQDYETMQSKEKLLNLYFVFVENLTLNRSLVLHLFSSKIAGIKRISALRPLHRQFIRTLDLGAIASIINQADIAKNAQKVASKATEEILWAHFVSVVEFWRNDHSPSFESTDVYIEKSIDTGFELANHAPLQKMIDMGKFLWKERFQNAR